MSEVDRLLAAFESGELLRPSAEVANFVDLARAIASLCGVEGVEVTPGAAALAERIGPSEHLVFVLADGVGMALLETMPPEAFLPRHLAMELRAVFPSTTATALTTLATAEWPAQHCVSGWWTYLREIDGAATILPFVRRSDETSLTDLGVTPEQAFPLPSLIPRMQRDVLSLTPARITETVYSWYWTGGTSRHGYRSLREAVDVAIRHIARSSGPTYTYLYMPRVDAAAHEHGTGAREVRAELVALDQQIARLATELAGRARIVVSADHGHLDVAASQRHLIEAGGAIAGALRAPPSGDPRVMYFPLRDDAKEGFPAIIAQHFGEFAFGLSVDDAETLELFGPGTLAPLMRERLGDFITITSGADVIGYGPERACRKALAKASHHSGLTPQEMRIPLVIA